MQGCLTAGAEQQKFERAQALRTAARNCSELAMCFRFSIALLFREPKLRERADHDQGGGDDVHVLHFFSPSADGLRSSQASL